MAEHAPALTRLHHAKKVTDVAFSADSTRLATASHDGTARVWDIASGREVSRFVHQTSYQPWVTAVAFSPDDTRIATASYDNTAHVWDIANGREVASFPHEASVADVAFSPESTRIATATADGVARVWDIGSGDEVTQFRHQERAAAQEAKAVAQEEARRLTRSELGA